MLQGFMLATLVAPIAGVATAGIAAYKTMKGKKAGVIMMKVSPIKFYANLYQIVLSIG
ncbi:hypothetical protein KHA80_21815 [Anaerobacillus sp. HL2]|nr:hypothetical protein KHA80_21815 [Anaerobacillus sp. HL2]